jgi:predicted DsbA family dithiol-disulfide isomerase
MRCSQTPAPGMVVVFSDIWCAFAHVAVYRLHQARLRLGLDNQVSFDHRAFPMELLNGNPGSRPGSDSEVPSVGNREPDAGWQLWQDKDWLYPSSSLPALEAVQAAKAQSIQASEALDLGLRRAFWAESRCITNRTVIVDVAARTPGVEAGLIADALEAGSARAAVAEQTRVSNGRDVVCSPHVFLPDGTDYPNPGMDVEWEGDWGVGYPRILRDDPSIYDEMLKRSLA